MDLGRNTGETALYMAADQGYAGIAELLLSDGANANARDSMGSTALIAASFIHTTNLLVPCA